ncbi:MAG TPA: hypothetical protein VN088_02500 [Nocardioides sp.]|nr:hypothetical protein [Nocardioides sp.]
MSLDVPTTTTRRHAAVAAALCGAALVVVGYASGWGLTLPVAGSVVAGSAPVTARPAGPPAAAAVPSMAMPAHHYVGSGPAVTPMTVVPTATPTPSSPTPAPPTTPPSHPQGSPGGPGTGSGRDCTGLRPMLQTLVQHVDAGHLEESPSQQVADLLDLDQYAATHATLLGNLLQPLLGGVSTDLDVLLQHIEAGHLEESPAQQVADLLNTDQYVKTHTVLIESLLKPLVGDSTC